jgi:hypothetical protein
MIGDVTQMGQLGGATPTGTQKLTRVTRRGVVAVVAAGVMSGCSGSGSVATAASPAPGTVARAQAAKDSTALLARYDSAAAAHPTLAAQLAPLRSEVAQHVRAFGGKPAAAPTLTPPATTSASAAASPAQALASLATAERDLADRRAKALLDAPGDLARLLASVAAAGAGHAVLLSSGAT